MTIHVLEEGLVQRLAEEARVAAKEAAVPRTPRTPLSLRPRVVEGFLNYRTPNTPAPRRNTAPRNSTVDACSATGTDSSEICSFFAFSSKWPRASKRRLRMRSCCSSLRATELEAKEVLPSLGPS